MARNESLRTKRLQRNWRQQDLADHLGTTVISIQRWERGIQQPGLYYRTKLCALFGVSPQELGFAEEPFPTTHLEHISPLDDPPPPLANEPFQQTRLWTIPYPRNPYFTGRRELLDALIQHVISHPTRTGMSGIGHPPPTQSFAIKGLGGIGKTQTAIEYAYHSFDENRYTHTLWISAHSEEAILSSFATLAMLLPDIYHKGEQDKHILATLVIRWLEQCQESWLLLFDNADEIELVSPYFPTHGHGFILLTTRVHAVGALTPSIEMEPLSVSESTHFLLRRSQHTGQASANESEQATRIVQELGCFPLALDQAGAYLEETGCSLEEYLDLLQVHRYALLKRRGRQVGGYPESIVTTWSLSFARVEQENRAASDLLQLCAFVAPDLLPEELLTVGQPYWPSDLGSAVADRLCFNHMLEIVLSLSLLKRAGKKQFSLHRLVQVVQRERLSREEQQQWAERLVLAVHALLPPDARIVSEAWPQCERLLEQAMQCAVWIEQYDLQQPEAVAVLERTAIYLRERATYPQADALFQHALRLLAARAEMETLQSAHAQLNMAILYTFQGRFQKAEALAQRGLVLREQHLGTDHPEVAQALHWLANIQETTGASVAQVEQLMRHALEIREQYLGADHLDTALSLYGLGRLYIQEKQFTTAISFTQRALHIWEHQFGMDDPRTALALIQMASIVLSQNRDEEAAQLAQMALLVQERHLGTEHPLLVYTLLLLGQIRMFQGQYSLTESLLQRAFRIREQSLGTKHPGLASPLHHLANLYYRQGMGEQAEMFYQRAFRSYEQFGEYSLIDKISLFPDIAHFRQMQGRLSDAVDHYREALALQEQRLGVDHLLTSETRRCLQGVLQGLDEKEKQVTPLSAGIVLARIW